MRSYSVWLTPHAGYKNGDDIFPVSCVLHYVLDKFGGKPHVEMPKGSMLFLMSEEQLNTMLHADADHWAYRKTGADHPAERYDRDLANSLFAEYKNRLAQTGYLDFTIPCAGVKA